MPGSDYVTVGNGHSYWYTSAAYYPTRAYYDPDLRSNKRFEISRSGRVFQLSGRIKSIGIAVLIGLAFAVGFYQACLTRHKVTAWDEYCSYVDGEDLYKKYRVAMLTFDYDSIRDDFVRKYHDSFIKDTKEQFGLQDKGKYVMSELERLKMLGAWREGTHLHAANNFVTSEPAAGGALTFSEWVAEYKKSTNPELLKNKGNMSTQEYCLFRTMNGEKETATIPLELAVNRAKK